MPAQAAMTVFRSLDINTVRPGLLNRPVKPTMTDGTLIFPRER
jgi:hypothetical protein